MTQAQPSPAPHSQWGAYFRMLSFRSGRASNSSSSSSSAAPIPPPLRSHDSVVGEGVFGHPVEEKDTRGLKKGVKNLIRRASHSLKHDREKSSTTTTVLAGPHRKPYGRRWKTVIGDAESGIVLDSRDTDECFYASAERRLDPARILPPEIVTEIFTYLDAATLLSCTRVSRAWHSLATTPSVWQSLFIRTHGPRYTPRPGRDWNRMFSVNHQLSRCWRKATDMDIKYLKGHSDSVYCVQFDTRKVITGSRDQSIKVWDIKTGECLRTLSEHAPITEGALIKDPFHRLSILCLQFDQQILVTGSSDTTCIVWELPSYRAIGRLEHHTAGVLDVCFDASYIVSCSKDTTICIWSRQTLKLLRHLTGHRGPVNAVAIAGSRIVSASGDALVKLWDLDSGACIRDFRGHHRGLACVQFAEGGRTVVSGGNDKDVRIWDADSGACLRTLTGHTDLVRTLHVDSTNRRIVSGSYDTTVKVWNLDSGEMILDIKRFHSTWILAAKADHRRIISTSQDARALVLDFGHKLDGLELLEEEEEDAAAAAAAGRPLRSSL